MTILPQLEADLYAAADARLGSASTADPTRPGRRRIGNLVPAAGVLVAVVVAALVVALAGRNTTAPRVSPATAGPAALTFRPLTTVAQMKARFGVLRRAQTAADRAWKPPEPTNARAVPQLTRLSETLANGDRLFLSVYRYLAVPANGKALAGTYSLDVSVVNRDGAVTSAPYDPNTTYLVYPITNAPLGQRRGYTRATFFAVVPDGVASVRWSFTHRGSNPIIADVRATGNVVATTSSGPGEPFASRVSWLSRSGQVLHSFTGGRITPRRGVATPNAIDQPVLTELARSSPARCTCSLATAASSATSTASRSPRAASGPCRRCSRRRPS
jgi:hypothetical protein